MNDQAGANAPIIIGLTPARLLTHTAPSIEILGNPTPREDAASVVFDGAYDGLLVHALDGLAGADGFDIDVRIKPHPDGAFEQRFFHVQDDASDDRLLMEIRLDSDGFWYADSYFESGGEYALLQDPMRRHPCGIWATYRVSYDGSEFSHAVDGTCELSVSFPRKRLPLRGVVSIGMRATREYLFCGEIGTVLATRSRQP